MRGLGPRFVVEAAFLVVVAVVAWAAQLSWPAIVLVMAVAWLLAAGVEWFASHKGEDRRRPAAGARREQARRPAVQPEPIQDEGVTVVRREATPRTALPVEAAAPAPEPKVATPEREPAPMPPEPEPVAAAPAPVVVPVAPPSFEREPAVSEAPPAEPQTQPVAAAPEVAAAVEATVEPEPEAVEEQWTGWSPYVPPRRLRLPWQRRAEGGELAAAGEGDAPEDVRIIRREPAEDAREGEPAGPLAGGVRIIHRTPAEEPASEEVVEVPAARPDPHGRKLDPFMPPAAALAGPAPGEELDDLAEDAAEGAASSPAPDAPREWNLWDLERLAREHAGSDAARDEEWSFLLMYLREFARPDGGLPVDFDTLVRESFAELLLSAGHR